jgi:hypothetical protein
MTYTTKYKTVRQMSEHYDFISQALLRKLIASDKQFQKKCVRRLGRKILLDEDAVLKSIADSHF